MFGSLGFTELILILFIVLIIFGAGKLPQLGEGVGKAIKGFKKSVQEAEPLDVESQQANTVGQETAAPPPPAPAQPEASTLMNAAQASPSSLSVQQQEPAAPSKV